MSRCIDADALKPDADYYEGDYWAVSIVQIHNAPTIEPERKKGRWIPEFNGMFKGGAYWFKCSECERIVPGVRNGGWNYCPNCGAKMED